jgi:3-isopropylmalate/(R)-2-methylmalate dehydratase large subunit
VCFLRERRGIDFEIESWMKSDPGAAYADVIDIDCSSLSPMVASPGDPGNGVALADLPAPVPINIAFAGTCTGGKREDFDYYHQVLSWAVERGMRVAPGVQLYLQFGTIAVREYCEQRGYLDVFDRVGAQLLQPSCGACANMGPGSSTDSGQVTVSAQNRNFPGRSGPGRIWLASPPTVVASALAGHLTSFEDLRERFEAETAI